MFPKMKLSHFPWDFPAVMPLQTMISPGQAETYVVCFKMMIDLKANEFKQLLNSFTLALTRFYLPPFKCREV